MVPFSAKVIKGTLDVFRHIFEIPFIYKSVDLPGFFVAFNRCIRSVDHADEPDTPNWEETVDVFFHELHVSGKARLVFTKNDIELSKRGISYQSIEFGTVPCNSGKIIVAVNIENLPSVDFGKIGKHRFLVLNTSTEIIYFVFVEIFLR